MMCREFKAPAKVNLCLHVEGRRDDGYHELKMIMQKISLYDHITISVATSGPLTVVCNDVPLAEGETNIVEQAARLILSYCRGLPGVEIVLEKNIPVAAGLGGGSSDAATVLLALNEMLDVGLDRQELHELALSLGADVPFFLQDQCVWAMGIGDQFKTISTMPTFHLVVVNPRVGVSTAQVYKSMTADNYSTCKLTEGFDDVQRLCSELHNDLESVAIEVCPIIETVKSVLRAHGAEGVLMSGSGATVFGVFIDQAQAKSVAEKIRSEHDWWVRAVFPV